MRAAWGVTLVLAVACGDDGGAGSGGTAGYAAFSCTSGWPTGDGGTGPPVVCTEASGGTAADVETNRQKCVAQRSTFTLAACTRTGAVGGCRVQSGGVAITTWYYADPSTTASDVQKTYEGLASVAPAGVTIEFVTP